MRAQCDRISSLPPSIRETILCLLPLQEAGRTSVLSKSWRYSWTKISKVAFDKSTFEVSPSKNDQLSNAAKCEFLGAVCQVLSLHHGPIHEFTLIMSESDPFYKVPYYEFDQITSHLVRYKTVKKLHLQYISKVPVYVLSLDQLEHLYLRNCAFNHLPTFNAFGSLTELYLDRVLISKKALMHILSNNPLLKSFTLLRDIYNFPIINDDSVVPEIFKCIPLIEDLTFCAIAFKDSAGDAASRVLPKSLAHLKYLWIESMFLGDDYELSFLFLMLRSSPNLKKLKLELDFFECDGNYKWEGYSDIRLDHLVEFEIREFNGFWAELELVKLILAKSPVLEKVRIFRCIGADNLSEEVKMLRFLLRYRRASPLVEIIVE